MKKGCQKVKVNKDYHSYGFLAFFCMGFEMAALLGVAVLCLVYPKDYSIPDNTALLFCCLLLVLTVNTILLIYGVVQYRTKKKQEGLEEELKELRMQSVYSQMQPHFIFNTLNTICQLCEEDPKLTQELVDHFATYLRMNIIGAKETECIPFAQELEHIRHYLWIEQLRFGDDIKVEYDIRYTDFLIPAMTLLPLVKNAVKYGVCKNEYGGTIAIRTHLEQDEIVITVEDDGPGVELEALPKEDWQYIRMMNPKRRLEILCQGNLEVSSEKEKGTMVRIKLLKEGKHESAACR